MPAAIIVPIVLPPPPVGAMTHAAAAGHFGPIIFYGTGVVGLLIMVLFAITPWGFQAADWVENRWAWWAGLAIFAGVGMAIPTICCIIAALNGVPI